MSAGAAVGIAGCGQQSGGSGSGGDGGGGSDGDGGDGGGSDGDDGGSGELGERVPPYVVEYWANTGGYTSTMEAAGPTIVRNFEELGLDVEFTGIDFSQQVSNTLNNSRGMNMAFWTHSTTPTRLAAVQYTERYIIDRAGNNGRGNPNQYASCEYSVPALQQRTAPDSESRRELVAEAHSIMSQDIGCIPITPRNGFGAVRTDEVEVNREGQGWTYVNPTPYIYSTPRNGNSYTVASSPVFLETRFFYNATDPTMSLWNHLIHSTLVEYDENFELQNMLASSVESTNESRNVVVELKDATFHNGDPVTAEDVKFTWELLWNNESVNRQGKNPPTSGWSVEEVDDRTVEFTFNEPWPIFQSREMPAWGIAHKQSFVEAGAQDDPGNTQFSDYIGSGPFQIANWEIGSVLEMEPHDGHPVHSPSHNILFQAFRGAQAMFNAFRANEVQFIQNFPVTMVSDVESMEQARATSGPGIMPWLLYPQMSHGASMFRALRDAMGTALNRQEIIQLAFNDLTEPVTHATPLIPGKHPFAPSTDRAHQFTDDPTGDIDAARQKLTDAGWGWDSDGRLHYPPDADLTPKWPEGEVPSQEEFPCLNENNTFTLEAAGESS
jgi:peptide/nickel transport system substrate-binding protein